MIVVICFLLFISLVVLAIFSEIERMRRAIETFCSFIYRQEWENDSDKKD